MYHGCIKDAVLPCDTIKYTIGVPVFVPYIMMDKSRLGKVWLGTKQPLIMQDSDYQTNKSAHRSKYTNMVHSELVTEIFNVKQISITIPV